jgi:hypothetical protein
MVLENLQATFGSEAGVRRHHYSQQLGVESTVHGEKPFNLPRAHDTVKIKIECREGAVDLQRLPDL